MIINNSNLHTHTLFLSHFLLLCGDFGDGGGGFANLLIDQGKLPLFNEVSGIPAHLASRFANVLGTSNFGRSLCVIYIKLSNMHLREQPNCWCIALLLNTM